MSEIFLKMMEIYEKEDEIKKLNKELKEKRKEIINEIKEITDNKAENIYVLKKDTDIGREIGSTNYKKHIYINGVNNIDVPCIIDKIHHKHKIGEYEIIIYNQDGSGEYEEKEKQSDILIRFEYIY